MSDRPTTVYLDSQDYSRFGAVLLGKGPSEHELLLRELMARQESGDAIFAYSMPILSELLQYDQRFAEEVYRKAEAVEQLCRGWSLIFPMRLVALEILRWEAASAGGDPSHGSPLTPNDYWHPNVGNVLADFRARSRTTLNDAVDGTSLIAQRVGTRKPREGRSTSRS